MKITIALGDMKRDRDREIVLDKKYKNRYEITMTKFPKMLISFHIFKMGTPPPHSTPRR